jgi:hypothetical protein
LIKPAIETRNIFYMRYICYCKVDWEQNGPDIFFFVTMQWLILFFILFSFRPYSFNNFFSIIFLVFFFNLAHNYFLSFFIPCFVCIVWVLNCCTLGYFILWLPSNRAVFYWIFFSSSSFNIRLLSPYLYFFAFFCWIITILYPS